MSLTPEQEQREREAFDVWFRDKYDIPLIRNSRAESAWLARAAIAHEERERLIKQLRTGGWLHHTHCDVRWKWNEATDLWDIRVGECTCGLDAALAKEG